MSLIKFGVRRGRRFFHSCYTPILS